MFGLNHREGEGDAAMLSSAGFYNVAPECEARANELRDALMPHLHAALVQIYGAVSTARPTLEVTHNERAILDLLLQGRSNKEIGRKLGKSDETVKHRLALLMHRLQVRNRTELVSLASHALVVERPGKRGESK